MTSIGNQAFCRSGLTGITLGNSMISIGASAFDSNGLTSIKIPNSVTSIGDQAFIDCTNLNTVDVSWNQPIPITQYVFRRTRLTTLYVPKGARDLYANSNWCVFPDTNIIEKD